MPFAGSLTTAFLLRGVDSRSTKLRLFINGVDLLSTLLGVFIGGVMMVKLDYFDRYYGLGSSKR